MYDSTFTLSISFLIWSSSTLCIPILVPSGPCKSVVPSLIEAATCNPVTLACKADERE